ncbi:MAG: hypothetical protein WCO78_00860 [Candidatus Roizmanbacteria bacterium]
MHAYRWITGLIIIILGVITVSSYFPVNAQWNCVRDSIHKNAAGVLDGVKCVSTAPPGQFITEPVCTEGCNRLCARGFSPACNFTSICKVYGFAINLTSVGAGLLALIFFLYGAYRYVMGKGEPEAIATAQSIIINAALGLILVVTAYSLARLILALLKVDIICF